MPGRSPHISIFIAKFYVMSKKKKLQGKHKQQTDNEKNKNVGVNHFDKLTGNKPFYVFLVLLAAIIYYVFKDYLLFHYLYLFKDIGSDTINVFYPNFVHISDYLRAEGIPKWSFQQGMGQNIFATGINRPLNWILFALGSEKLAYGIVYVEVLKIFMGGILFYLYLRKIELSGFVATIGGLLFAFCGFMIIGSGWYVFSTRALYAVFLLYAFERLYKDNKWYFFPLAVALIGMMQPFNLYLYGLFILIYAIFRYIDDKGMDIKGFLRLFGKMAMWGTLGVLISSVFLFSRLHELMNSPRMSGDESYASGLISAGVLALAEKKHYVTAVLRLFSNDLAGNALGFKGWYNYLEAPMLYCGLASLLIAPQVFCFLKKRQQIIYAILLLLFILPVIFPWFRHAFWLFTGDYYRDFSLLLVIILLLYSLRALHFIERNNNVNLLLLLVTFFILMGLLYFPYYPVPESPVNKDIRSTVRTYLILYTVIICLFNFKNFKQFAQYALLVVVCFELAQLSSVSINEREPLAVGEYRQKSGYNDYTVEAIDFIKNKDEGFYRVNKNYASGPAMHSSLNDAKAQGYYGTASYSSFNQMYYIDFLKAVGLVREGVETDTRWARGLKQTPLLQTLGSVKYNLFKEKTPPYISFVYDSLTSFHDVTVYENRNFLPLGFSYGKYILRDDYNKLSMAQRSLMLFKACVVQEPMPGLTELNLADTARPYSWNEHAMDVRRLKKYALDIDEHSQNMIRGTISTDAKRMVFFSIPFDKGWKCSVDGERVEPLLMNIGFTGLLMEEGEHTVLLEYHPPFVKAGTIITIISLITFIVLVIMRNKTAFLKDEQ